jgi:hypothetical protein
LIAHADGWRNLFRFQNHRGDVIRSTVTCREFRDGIEKRIDDLFRRPVLLCPDEVERAFLPELSPIWCRRLHDPISVREDRITRLKRGRRWDRELGGRVDPEDGARAGKDRLDLSSAIQDMAGATLPGTQSQARKLVPLDPPQRL